MTRTRFMLMLSLLGGMALASGCKGLAGCLKPLDAADTQDRPPLRIPVGLDAPDTREALKIPALDAPAAPPVATGCLEDPPMITPLVPPDPKAKKDAEESRKSGRTPRRAPYGGRPAP